MYFIDTGIRNTAVNDFRGLGDRPDKGSLLENALVMQFIKQAIDFNFWRDKKRMRWILSCRLATAKYPQWNQKLL